MTSLPSMHLARVHRQKDLCPPIGPQHMDKHERPYSCTNPMCNGITFGDKGGLLRHQREKHGTLKFFCPISACPRHKMGFPRKDNLDSHVRRRHPKSPRGMAGGITSTMANVFSESPVSIGSANRSDEYLVGYGGVEGLKAKLEKLKAEKKELDVHQLKVDEDIQVLEMAIQLMSEGSYG
ncbi:hypothetical protein DL98DRAFT_593474 [Cadophora sp. DSE1049]|nr:hypothetical protein DL98DRAFT_593474 [Cadophora sp. DSE1049]